MTHYMDIRVLADPEFPGHQLMSALCAKLHRALVSLQAEDIGVSFPGYVVDPPTLGHVLRILGPADQLTRLTAAVWLTGVRDHVAVCDIAPVPAGAAHRTLRRIQAKSSPERLRRRQIRRHGITADEACERVPDFAAERLKLPFFAVASTSTGQSFRMFLRLGPLEPRGEPGRFNSYGLSATTTIPWF